MTLRQTMYMFNIPVWSREIKKSEMTGIQGDRSVRFILK